MIDPSERVAIVGIGGVFPGAPDPEQFWSNVAAGVDATTEVPPGRWSLDPADAYDPRVAAPDRVYATRGGFVEGFRFDPEGLDLDPGARRPARPDVPPGPARRPGRLARREDGRGRPVARRGRLRQHRPADRGGLGPGRRDARADVGGKRCSAVTTPSRTPTEPLNRFAAGLPAGLLAKALGLGGGAYTLDAACASSLYALKLAADELLAGRADAMITGGLSRPDPLYTQMGFSQLRALSPDGRAYPFDGAGRRPRRGRRGGDVRPQAAGRRAPAGRPHLRRRRGGRPLERRRRRPARPQQRGPAPRDARGLRPRRAGSRATST